MLFRIDLTQNVETTSLQPVEAARKGTLGEVELEKLIVGTAALSGSEVAGEMNSYIFGEELLFLSHQTIISDKKKSDRKRLDILALDSAGRVVIIELKRDEARLGVDTQALQYLSRISALKGDQFLKYIRSMKKLKKDISEADYIAQIQDSIDYPVSQINSEQRIILLARNFDPALFSMGEWLSSKDIGFKCISYTPYEFDNDRFISFSVEFDRSTQAIHRFNPYTASMKKRAAGSPPKDFWHVIGKPRYEVSDEKWWADQLKHRCINCGFKGERGDRGFRILDNLIIGDRIFAYLPGVGAVGMGVISGEYSLVQEPVTIETDIFRGDMRHRRPITWLYWLSPDALSPAKAISAERLRQDDLPTHPVATHATIRDVRKARELERLMANLAEDPNTGWRRVKYGLD